MRCEEVNNYYYEAVQINVIKSDIYNFFIDTPNNKYGYLYIDYFNPFKQSENLLLQRNIRCVPQTFEFVLNLHANTTYVLVMITYDLSKAENLSVIASGIGNVTFNRLSK
jgi:hypothetical protein